jgi:hypothetical protein
MKTRIACIIFILFATYKLNAQNSTAHTLSTIPFQGTKEFCESYRNSKYIVNVKNNIVIISLVYKEDTSIVHGKIINGKLFTDDREEKSDKRLAGKYYLLTKEMIRILNTENGDYDEYDVCK